MTTPASSASFRRRAGLGGLAALLWVLGSAAAPARAAYTARLTQVDDRRFPDVSVYVSIADERGRAVSKALPMSLNLWEEGRLVLSQELAQGRTTANPRASFVLALDTSGSMSGDKLAKAVQAAGLFLDLAPPEAEIALVRFSSVPELVSGFTADHEALKQKMHAFSADGNTALQDAIDRGLGLLLGREGRLAIVALTDGAENNSSKFSGAEGQGRLLQAAKDASVTVCCIGLGGDVETAYLSRYQATGGWYLFAPDAGALQRTFSTLADYLAKEWQFQYRSPFQATDGTRRAISATLEVSGQATPVAPLRYVAPGLLPNVRSVHAPFLALLLGLLALPALARTLSQGIGLLRFRARRVQRLGPQSPLLGRQDPNGHAFGAGDWVVSCPKCQRAHWVRSWRHNRCRCMVEPEGQACFCFASLLPGWSRRALHRLSGHSLRPGAGQVWMCKCAGDKEGY